jgi:hypothetical protein
VSLVHSSQEAAESHRISGLVESLDLCRTPAIRNASTRAMRLGTRETLTHLLLDSPKVLPALRRIVERQPPDVVLAYCSGMGRFAMHPVLAGFPLVVDMVDVDSMKWRGLAARHGGPMGWIYRREATPAVPVRERARNARQGHGRRDPQGGQATCRNWPPRARVLVSPIGVDADRLRPPAAPRRQSGRGVLRGHELWPNEDAAAWVVRAVWPAVRKRKPGARLLLLGARASTRVRRLRARSTEWL